MTELDTSRDTDVCGTGTHVFDDAVALVAADAHRYTGRTHPAYANMVGPFGGITAATLLRAVQQHPEVLGVPLSLTVNYCGALADGEFEIVARPVRTNRSTQHWSIELSQDGAVTTTATAVFGTHRETWSSTEAVAPDAPPAQDAAQQSLPEFIAWSRNYEMRFVEGAVPGPETGENPDSTTTLWEQAERLAALGLRHVLCTDTARDGALAGPNLALYAECVRRHPGLCWQASGGVRDGADLAALAATGVAAAISGRALVEERLSPEEIAPFLPAA